VDNANMLLAFGALRPDLVRSVAITGLAAGETVHGIDFRPADGKLYALGSTRRIYVVDTVTAVATVVGTAPFTPALIGLAFGFDFNPVVDRVRVHSDQDENLRLDPATGAVAAVDGVLAYRVGDPSFGFDPAVTGTAYTNSVAGATTTVLYGIDAARDALVSLSTPNDGMLSTVAALAVTSTVNVGFDIAGNNGSAYVTLTTGQGANGTGSTLFQINLNNGALFIVGNVSSTAPLRSIAIAP
jgi:hypothetical protein